MDLAASLQSVRQRIAAACQRSGRDPAAVTLLAVSKNQPPETIRAAAAAGLSLFGENRVQEAKSKISQCPGALRWHMIGHLQSNKCRDAVSLFSMIQSVDSLPLAVELNKWAGHFAKTMPVLLEINIAGESSKFGCSPRRTPGRPAPNQRPAPAGNPRPDDRRALRPRPGKSPPRFPPPARIEGRMRKNPGRSPACYEHGHDRRF